ncbi:isochorismatase family cysteine hydrolase [Dyella humicola]|uniref:isochorismatase family cysteine hydrolase n=1 Tax=Dyella humicola TaxID=2992126 RepID=UPI002257BCE1|nr:isochorismatase family cysteine hydrolase [Dyella humicola]
MPHLTYPSNRTAYLLVDPYNDFLSHGGKVWPRLEPVANDINLLEHLVALDRAMRAHGIPIFFVPHRRWEAGDYEDWAHPTPSQRSVMRGHHFARGEWGGDWYPELAPKEGDVVVAEHWGSSGFANTDLDLRLKQRGITHVIFAGLLANTCIECSARFASELGYHVTLVRDATAALSPELMHAAHELNGPTYAHAILTTEQLIASLP